MAEPPESGPLAVDTTCCCQTQLFMSRNKEDTPLTLPSGAASTEDVTKADTWGGAEDISWPEHHGDWRTIRLAPCWGASTKLRPGAPESPRRRGLPTSRTYRPVPSPQPPPRDGASRSHLDTSPSPDFFVSRMGGKQRHVYTIFSSQQLIFLELLLRVTNLAPGSQPRHY